MQSPHNDKTFTHPPCVCNRTPNSLDRDDGQQLYSWDYGWVAITAGTAHTISMPLLSKFSNQLKPLICLMTVKTQPFMFDTANNIERNHFIEETV